MLETNFVVDKFLDVGDGFDHFGQQHSLSFYITEGHQHSTDVNNIEIQSPTFTNHDQL